MAKGGSGGEKGRRLQCRKMRRRTAAPHLYANVGSDELKGLTRLHKAVYQGPQEGS
jgi:hypothetical protein